MRPGSVASRTEAQRRADEVRIFRSELQRLQAEGVLRLDEAQRLSLDAHHDALLASLAADYDIDRDSQARQLSLGMRVASFLGALALAASVFFLFYQFWGRLGTAAQVFVLVAAPLATLMATLWLAAREASGYYAKLAAMVTFACFVLDLVMMGAIFNITPSDKAFLAWAALAFLLAYACDLRLLLAAGILCLAGFVSARTATWSGVYWLNFGERPETFFPVAALLLLVPPRLRAARFAHFESTYRVFGLLFVFIPVLVLANWGRASYLPVQPVILEGAYQVLGFALAAAAAWLGVKRDMPDVTNTGVVFFVLFLYTKLFDWWWEIMPKWLFFLVLGLVAVLLLTVFKRLRRTTA